MDLTVEMIKEDKTTILKIKGILDISTTNLIDPYLEEIEDDCKELIFDFKELEFIDSTGIGSIMNAIHLSQEKKFKIQFKKLDEITRNIFETIGLFDILEALQGEVV